MKSKIMMNGYHVCSELFLYFFTRKCYNCYISPKTIGDKVIKINSDKNTAIFVVKTMYFSYCSNR